MFFFWFRYYGDVPLVRSRNKGYQREASAVRDELDMLQEENETVLDKVQCLSEARARELEKQRFSRGQYIHLLGWEKTGTNWKLK
ncbi:unnamed protein product [Brassica oleracea var. botrytis]